MTSSLRRLSSSVRFDCIHSGREGFSSFNSIYYDDGGKEHNFTVRPFMEAPCKYAVDSSGSSIIKSLYQRTYQANIINYRGQLKT